MISYQSDEESNDVDVEEVLSEFSTRTRDRGFDYQFSATFETEREIIIDDL